MKNIKLTQQEIKKIRSQLVKRLKEYQGTEHIKLYIEPLILEQIIFEEKVELAAFLDKIVHNPNIIRVHDKYKIFAIDFELLKKLDLTGVSFWFVNIINRDFTGSKGVKINPQFVYLKHLGNTILNGVELTDSLDGCHIAGANFEGSKGGKVNPQTIPSKNLSYTVLKDVAITGYLDDCNIKGTVFEPQIDIDKLYQRPLTYITRNINEAFGESSRRSLTFNKSKRRTHKKK